jgi:hypothetical protein
VLGDHRFGCGDDLDVRPMGALNGCSQIAINSVLAGQTTFSSTVN